MRARLRVPQFPLPQLYLSPANRGALYYFVYWGATGIYEPFLNVHFADIGLSRFEIGLLAALFPLITLMVAPPLSALADRLRQRRRTMALLLIGFAPTLFLTGLPRTFTLLILVVSLLAFFRGPITPIGDSLISRMAERHGLNFGSMRLWGSLGFAIISTTAGLFWAAWGATVMFAVAGLLFLPVIGLTLLLEEGVPVEHHLRRPLRELLRSPALRVLLATSFLMGAAMSIVFNFEGIYLQTLGGSQFMIGLLFGLIALCELPPMYFAALLRRRLGGAQTLLLAYGLLGASYLGLGLVTTPAWLLADAVLQGFGFGLFFVSAIQLLNDLTPPEWSSTAQALFNACAFGLSWLIATPLGGWGYDQVGPGALFTISGLLVVVAMLLLIAAMSRGLFAQPPPPNSLIVD
ncbi:MAG: MFS transporter [Chloroflexota bacterium]|nr:MFS transporter [Chloroflexota bacterium]